ncbi:MAG: efflux RND transporter periplasmic adaptor subunit [Candidatus Gracilibacteria bacterium]|nr:efflux RND transporter periplasmic adaptor subunit [Candidatus Gracilibacteria bacterium]
MKINPLKRIKKFLTFKKIILLIIIIVAGSFGYKHYFGKSTTATYTNITSKVKKSTIENAIKVTGTAEIVDEQKIRFNQTGKVAKVYFKDGDKVKKGEIIAELDLSDVNNTIKQSEIGLENSKITLQELYEGKDKSQILKAKNDVTSAEQKLILSKQSLEDLKKEAENKINSLNTSLKEQELTLNNTLKDAKNSTTVNQDQIDQAIKDVADKQDSYEFAKKDLEDTKVSEKQSIIQTQSSYNLKVTNAIQNIKNAVIEAETIANDVDDMIGITDQSKNKLSYYEYIGTKNLSLKNSMESSYRQVINKKAKVSSLVNSIDPLSVDLNSLLECLDSTKDLFNTTFQLTDNTYNVIWNSVTSSTFTESQLDSLKNTASSKRSTTQSRLSSIASDISTIQSLESPSVTQTKSDNTIKKKDQAVTSAAISLDNAKQTLKELQNGIDIKNTDKGISVVKLQNTYDSAKKTLEETQNSYNTQIQTKENDIKDQEKQLVVTKQTLTETLEGPTSEQITKAENDIVKQELSLESAKKNLDKYRLEAPFDGVARKIDFKVGDNITSDEEKYVYIENPNLIKITATLDQIDIAKVQIGQKTKIVFDSFSDKEFEGSVQEIDSTPLETSGVTSYTVTISMDKGENKIYSGMTAKVSIITESKENILVIPTAFIEKSQNRSFVLVQSGTGEEIAEVVTGLSNTSNIEIASGLDEGETVIRKVSVSASSGSTSTQKSLFGGPGGGGGEPGGGNSNRSSRNGG